MNKLQTLKCVEVTSQTQADNGTVCYHDPITSTDYLSYESGYIRRAYTRNYENYKGYGWSNRTIYQLNPTKKSMHEWNGSLWPSTERIMIEDPNERLNRLAKAVVNYRKTLSKNA
tara:strand:+ start:127 stop:471 length:345 start_codon:yes stop_codon:yes gene_type:complete